MLMFIAGLVVGSIFATFVMALMKMSSEDVK